MEFFDICNEDGQPTGRTVSRDEAHEKGILHRTAHVWIVRGEPGSREVLLQKRSLEKDSFPGQYDTSSAGHVQAGDEPLPSALRELQEELGIAADPDRLDYAGRFRIRYDLMFHGKPFRDSEIAWVYVYRGLVDEKTLTLQPGEVDEVRWFALEEVLAGVRENSELFCVPPGGLDVLCRFLGEERGNLI